MRSARQVTNRQACAIIAQLPNAAPKRRTPIKEKPLPLLSLAHMCVLELTPPEMVSCAADAGFSGINLRLSPARETDPQYPMIGNTPMMRETLARLEDTGIKVLDVEVLWLRPDTKPGMYNGVFEAAAQLGTRQVLAAGLDPDFGRATETYARFCEEAQPFGLNVNLEFMVISEVKTLAAAQKIISAAAKPNSGILIDALHIHRCGSPLDSIAGLDPVQLRYMQLCDAPAKVPDSLDDLRFEARHNRLPPGEGGLPLRELMNALPGLIDISVETPLGGERGKLPASERAEILFESSSRFLEG